MSLYLGAMCLVEEPVNICRSQNFQVEDEVCGVCFAHFKGLLRMQFPLKNLLPLARLPSWHGCVTGLP